MLRRNSLPFGVGVAALVGLNPLVYILGTQITYPAIGMLLVIVGGRRAGARLVLGDRRHRGHRPGLDPLRHRVRHPGGDAGTFVSQMVKANALAIVLNVARTRTVQRFEQARLEVHRLATTDELTGLANQRGLLEVGRATDRDDAGPDRSDLTSSMSTSTA